MAYELLNFKSGDVLTAKALNLMDVLIKNNEDALENKLDSGDYALKTDIPSLEGIATEEWVSAQSYLTEHQDLSSYALKSEIPLLDGYAKTEDIPSLNGYATEEWVEGKGYITSTYDDTDVKNRLATLESIDHSKYLTEHLDLSEYTKKSELPTKISAFENDSNYVSYSTYGDKKAITLNNHDLLLGTDTTGMLYNIAMISKWDIVDLGTTSLPINLNTPAGVRPTVQEAGKSGEESEKIAFLSDIDYIKNNYVTKEEYNNLLSRIEALEEISAK